MSEVDLTKAVDAASEAQGYQVDGEAAIHAALPHILAALAEQALAEAKADPGYPYAPTHAYDAFLWLKAKAGT